MEPSASPRENVSGISSPLGSPRVERGAVLVIGSTLVLGVAGLMLLHQGWARLASEVAFVLSLSSLIGYGTNWIAVEMLFWPPRRGGWWILGWRGLIYEQKEALAEWIPHAMEERNLISSRAILFHLFGDRARSKQTLDSLFRVLENLVEDPEFVDRVVREITRAVERVSPVLIEEFLEEGDERLKNFLENRLDPEAVVDTVVGQFRIWTEDEAFRRRLTDFLETVIVALSPRIARAIHLTQREQNAWYRLAADFGVMDSSVVEAELNKLFKQEPFWTRISDVLKRYLREQAGREETRDRLVELLRNVQPHLVQWFRERGADRLNRLLKEEIQQRDLFGTLVQALRENREGVLDFLGETFARPSIQHLFRRLTELLIDEFQLKAMLRQQILQQDPADFKRMIERATERHLRVIKVLGAGVGALCGIFLLPGSLRWAGVLLVMPGVAVGVEYWRQNRLRRNERPRTIYRWSARMLLAVTRSGVATPGPRQMTKVKDHLQRLFPDLERTTELFREERRQFADGIWEAQRLGETLEPDRRRALWEAVVDCGSHRVNQPPREDPFLKEIREKMNLREETEAGSEQERISHHTENNEPRGTPRKEPVGAARTGTSSE